MTPWVQKYDVGKTPTGLLVASTSQAAQPFDMLIIPGGLKDAVKFGPSPVSKMWPVWCLSQELPGFLSEGRFNLAKDILDAHDDFERRLSQTALARWAAENE
jgi:hypothetical protein